MRQQTKNALIAFLVGYLIVDFVGVAMLSKKNPVCLQLFFGDFKNKWHVLIPLVALIVAYLTFKHLQKEDDE